MQIIKNLKVTLEHSGTVTSRGVAVLYNSCLNLDFLSVFLVRRLARIMIRTIFIN